MKTLKPILTILALLPLHSYSAIYGQYVDNDALEWPAYEYVGQEPVSNDSVFICTDKTSRYVPGKLIINSSGNETCYTPWKGKEYANSDFNVLVSGNYRWVGFSQSNKNMILDKGITGGGYDAGQLVYHCKNLEGVVGKYVPGYKDICLFGWDGREKSSTHFRVLISNE